MTFALSLVPRARVQALLFSVVFAGAVLSSAGSAFATGISGVVTSKLTGLPVAGVIVQPMRLIPGTSSWTSAISVATVADGSYTISLSGGGTYRLMLRDPSGQCASQWYPDVSALIDAHDVVVEAGEDVSGVDASLVEPAPSITLGLTDADSGDPIAAGVTPMMRMPNGQWASVLATTGQQDSEGHIKISGLAPGYYLLKIAPSVALFAAGYPVSFYSAAGMGGAPTPIRVLPGQQVVGCDMTMSPAAGTIGGHVLDGQDGPVNSVRITCSTRLAGQDLIVATVFSQPDGYFSIPRLIPGDYKLDFYPSALVYAVDSMPASTVSGSDYLMHLAASSSIAGTVTIQPDGSTKSGFLVRAYEYVDGVCTGYNIAASTAANGSYKVVGVRPGSYRLMVTQGSAGDYASGTWPSGTGAGRAMLGDPIAVESGSATTGISVELQQVGHLAGRITDATTGDPVGILSVRCYAFLNGQWLTIGKSDAATHADGTYEVTGLNPGTYRVRFFDTLGRYTDRYFGESGSVADVDSATDVVVSSGETTVGINGEMGGTAPGEASANMSVVATGAPGEVTMSSDETQTDGLNVSFADAGLGGVVSAHPMDLVETPAPEGVTVLGDVVDISTTALYDGGIKITMPYDESAVVGPESDVKMYHYDDGEWVDVTTSVDTTANTVTGVTTSLSPIAQVMPTRALVTHTLIYFPGAHGSIEGSSSQVVAEGASGTEVTATAGPGYHFVKWSDEKTDNPRTDTGVSADTSVTAIFAINPAPKRIPKLTIRSDRATSWRGHSVLLSGIISPNVANRTHVTVWMRRSGSGTWKRLSTRDILSSHHWSYRLSTRSRKHGTYYLQVRFAGSASLASATSANKKLVIR